MLFLNLAEKNSTKAPKKEYIYMYMYYREFERSYKVGQCRVKRIQSI
jgi:hypothetical protein